MTTLKLKTIVGGLAASLLLAVPLSAQMGQMKSIHGKGGMMGMGCPMNMAGNVTMNGQSCRMKADMTPIGKSKGMMPKGMNMGSMGHMNMGKPMKMAGTMTCMGQTYHCTMMMTPQGK